MAKPNFGSIEESKDPQAQALIKAIRDYYHRTDTREPLAYIYAAAIWESRQRNFMKHHDVKASKRHVIAPGTLSGKRFQEFNGSSMGMDHTTLWAKNGKPHLITTEPYQIHKRELKKLIAHCDEYGVDFTIDTHSSYFPSRTLRILFQKDKDAK